jgi:hypothetical protein
VPPLIENLSQSTWRPLILPPRLSAGADLRPLYVALLMDGFRTSYHMHVLGRSYDALSQYRRDAIEASKSDETLRRDALAGMSALTPSDGLYMARIRGDCQLPYWSRLAILDYRKQGYTLKEIGEAFICSPRNVVKVINQVYLIPVLKLTPAQRQPSGRFISDFPKFSTV